MKRKVIYIVFILSSLGLINSSLEAQQGSACLQAESSLRGIFMENVPGRTFVRGELEDLFFACTHPSARSNMIYYYFKSYNSLNPQEEGTARPDKQFYRYYNAFNGLSSEARGVASEDKAFAIEMLNRAEDLHVMVNEYEQLAQAELGEEPDLSRVEGEVSLDELSRNPYDVEDTGGWGRSRSDAGPSVTPIFPLPPPNYSALVLPPQANFKNMQNLGGADSYLRGILQRNGYYDLRYYSVAAGFAIVTQMERIHPNGNPMESWMRWETSVGYKNTFALRQCLLSLGVADAGYYRVMAFTISPKSVTNNPMLGLGRNPVGAWDNADPKSLPLRVAEMKYGWDYQLTSYVFEFEVRGGSEAPRLVRSAELGGRGLSGIQHLTQAGVWKGLMP